MVAREFGWFPGCCYAVTKIFYIADVFWVVARVTLYNWRVYKTCYYVVAREFGWFPGCCYAVTKIFYVGSMLLAWFLMLLKWLLRSFMWFAGCCYAVSKVFLCVVVVQLQGI